jgi:putative endonuclease
MILISEFGSWAEEYVAKSLKKKGYIILDQNYRKPWGEIDIIAEKKGIIVFIEVKANQKRVTGFEPENRVSEKKLQRLYRAIETYLASKNYSPNCERQIDIIALTLEQERGVVEIKHFKNVDM